MFNTLKKLFFVSRPISWPNTAYPFIAGYIVSGGVIDLTFIIAAIYFLGPYNLLMYGINDVFDYESDIRNPRKGGIEGMREQRAFHPTIVRAALYLNIPFVVWMIVYGTPVSSITLLVLLFFVVAYSLAKLRFKERPVLDSITSSIHFVGPLIFALTLTSIQVAAIPYVVAFFLWGIASHAFGAVQDIIPDRKGKLASIATVFGAKWTMRIAFALYIIASTIVVFQPMPYAVVGVVGLFYAFNIMKFIHISDKESPSANVPWRRFIWLNLFTGFVVTMVLIYAHLA